MISDDLIAKGAVTVLGKIAEEKSWKKLISLLRKKKKILLLGASGAGKTQFISSLSNSVSEKIVATRRTVSNEKRRVEIDDYPFLIIDTPGQVFDESIRKEAIKEAFSNGLEGIINIVSYGYHESDEADRSRVLKRDDGIDIREDFLVERRRVEIDLLSEWVNLFDRQTASWILTVITKADLWWPDKDHLIKQYYQTGEYAGIVAETKIPHSVIEYCSVIEPFFGIRTSGQFGDSMRLALRNHLRESLIRLIGVSR